MQNAVSDRMILLRKGAVPVASGWIRQGIVSPENIVQMDELNALKRIRAILYQE